MQVCLFDIDGTLINTGGAGGSAMLAAIEEEFGVSGPLFDIPVAGRTDRAISLDVFTAYELPFSELSFRQFLDCYLRLLPLHLQECAPRGEVFPGSPGAAFLSMVPSGKPRGYRGCRVTANGTGC